jgi:hypothetical protein
MKNYEGSIKPTPLPPNGPSVFAPPLGYDMVAVTGTFRKRSVLLRRIRRTSFRRGHLEWWRERRRAPKIDTLFAEKMTMRMRIVFVSAVVLLSALATPAAAKGCLKGAVVGGVVGHYARHHGVIGAAVGCLIGRHQAKKRARAQQHTLLRYDRAGQSE